MRTSIVLLLSSVASAQTTWLVDDSGGPGVNFTSLPAAVAAAASGDTLVVAAGNYEAFHVADKALTILGQGSASTAITTPNPLPSLGGAIVVVATPPPGTTFRMSGVDIRSAAGDFLAPPTGLQLTGNPTSGNVVLTDVVVSAASPFTMATGLGVEGVDVFAARCHFTGGVFGINGLSGRDAASLGANGRLVVDACSFRGGSPPASPFTMFSSGGRGLVVAASRAWIWRSTIEGGASQASYVTFSSVGGAGLSVDGSSVVRVHGSSSDKVAGGSCVGPVGVGGAGILSSSGATVNVSGAVIVSGGSGSLMTAPATSGPGITLGLPATPTTTLTGTPTVSSGGDLDGSLSVTLLMKDAPQQLALLFMDVSPTVIELPGISDQPLLVPPTALVLFAGALDANGEFGFSLVPSIDAPVIQNLPLYLQGFVFDTAAGMFLGSNLEIRRIR